MQIRVLQCWLLLLVITIFNKGRRYELGTVRVMDVEESKKELNGKYNSSGWWKNLLITRKRMGIFTDWHVLNGSMYALRRYMALFL